MEYIMESTDDGKRFICYCGDELSINSYYNHIRSRRHTDEIIKLLELAYKYKDIDLALKGLDLHSFDINFHL